MDRTTKIAVTLRIIAIIDRAKAIFEYEAIIKFLLKSLTFEDNIFMDI